MPQVRAHSASVTSLLRLGSISRARSPETSSISGTPFLIPRSYSALSVASSSAPKPTTSEPTR